MKYRFVKGLLWLMAAAVMLQTRAYARDVSPADSVKLPENFVCGTLDNGLSYILVHNDSPSRMVECRLMFRAGSVLEDSGSRGAAHFLEHMAFGGTKHFPDRKLVEYIESLGVQYGYGINAYTGYDRTIYMFSVPTDIPRSLDNAMLIMEDWLTGIILDEEDVAEEKGIILSELRNYEVGDNFYDLKMGCGKYSEGIPLGTNMDIMKITPEILRNFHSRWYTLSQATVVMVGDIDTDIVRKKIEKKLGKLAPSSSPDYREFPMEYAPGTSYAQVEDTLKRGTLLEVFIPHKAVMRKTMGDALESARRSMLVRAVSSRFDDAEIPASVSNSWYLADTDHFIISVEGDGRNDVLSGLSDALVELRRISDEGFCEDEMSAIMADFMKSFSQGSRFRDRRSTEICASIEDVVLFGDCDVTDPQQYAWLKSRLEETDSEDLQSMLKSWLEAAETSRLAAYVYNPDKTSPASAEAVDSVWNAASAAEYDSYVYVTEESEPEPEMTPVPSWLTEDHPFDSSMIASRTDYPQSGIEEVILQNGFRFVLRPTDDEEDRLQMHIFAPGGLSAVPEEDYPLYEGLAGYMELGGIEGLDDYEYGSILAENGLGILVAMGGYWHEVIASGPSANQKLLLNLVKRKMTAPRLNYEDFEELIAGEKENFGEESYLTKLMKTDWSRQLGMKVDSLMGNVMYGRREATVEDLDRMSLDDMASMYRKLYSNPDGMTCVICGSFDPDSLLAAAVPLFGTMESAGSPNAMGESHFSLPSQRRMLEFPQVNDSQISFDYLQFGHYEPSLKNTLKLKLVRDVIRDRLITVLRERESLVYSPYISLYSKVFDDGIYYFDINAAVSPENTAKAIEVIDTILEDLQKNKISRKELSTLQRTFIVNKRNHLEEESTTNWKNYLVDEIKLGEKLEDIEEYERVLGSISPAELREAFREYIDRDRFIILSLGEFNMD